MALRHPLVVAAPGVVALVLAAVALLGSDTAPEPAAAPAPSAGERPRATTDFATLYRRVDGAVARIDARRSPSDPPFSNGRRVATGAAWLIDERGHLVTNAHVVDDADSASVRFGRSARRVPARIVGRDPATDLAVVRVDREAVRAEAPLPLARAGSIDVGEPVLALGTPYRLQSSASAGIVSATGRQISGLTGRVIADAVQTDTAINPGNSGGPLVDASGAVVGVNTQGRAAGVSFAVGADTVRRVVPQLIRDGRARTPILGVGLGEATDRGTPLRSVDGDGPAGRAGLRSGDVVVAVGGRPTRTEGSLPSAVARLTPGTVVVVRVRRDGRERDVRVRVGAAPDAR
jgi:S1-C subfamily serine protease